MSLSPQLMPGADYGELAGLRERMGGRLFEKRLERQAGKRAKLIHQGEGVFRLERFIPFDAVVDRLLRIFRLREAMRRRFLDVRVERQEWKIPALPSAFEGFRLLQVSDLHCDLDDALTPVVENLVRSTPHDAAVVTGDFRNGMDGDHGPCLRELVKICAVMAPIRFGILGNHDFLEMVSELEDLGLAVLLNESTSIERNGRRLWIAGIDDPHFYKTHDIAKARAEIPQNACSILLSHSPETFAEAAAAGFQLQLSGHTHGGQICLPGGHALVVPCRVPRKFVAGRWSHAGLQGYTSRGTGGCGVAARWNCPPEITLHILRAA
ncbi:MAG: metallophosphoesterase [Verrucomicrobiota bacterium]